MSPAIEDLLLLSPALERDGDEYPYQILIKVISYKSRTDELSVRAGASKMGACLAGGNSRSMSGKRVVVGHRKWHG